MAYRPEIDGLRFIAITTVLFFHLGFSDWGGGFTGVDIFFVLSGYLICGQIYVALSENRFSAIEFFMRRIRRLSSAAFACFFATGIAAYVLFSPFEMAMVVRNLLGSITFTNNLLLMNEAGYFAPSADTNPYLHTWSLSIEEQFYIVLPLAIIALRYRLQSFVILLVAAFMISLGLTLFSGDAIYSQEQRYFSSLLRIWELALGGLTFITLQRLGKPLKIFGLPVIGVLAMIVPTFVMNEGDLHPGPWALVATFGTAAMLLSAAPSQSRTGRVLASRVPRYLGRISYGTYLWHWPIIVFYQYLGGDLNDKSRVLAILASFGLGALSHHAIEQPVRRVSIGDGRKLLFGLFVAQTAVLIGLAGALWLRGQNVDPEEYARYARIQENAAIANENWDQCWYQNSGDKPCTFGMRSADARPVLLWGDSMANSASFALAELAKARATQGTLFATPNCPPLLGVVRDMSNASTCLEMNAHVLTLLDQAEPTDIVLFGRWPHYGEGVRGNVWGASGMVAFVDEDLNSLDVETLPAFKAGLDALLKRIDPRHRVIVVSAAPEFPFSVPEELVKAIRFGTEPKQLTRSAFEGRARKTLVVLGDTARGNGARYVDVTEVFCDATACDLLQDGLPIYADHVHFTRKGNEMFVRALLPALE